MTSDFLEQEQDRVLKLAQRVLVEGWWLHERAAIDILVVSDRMPLIDAQARRAISSGVEPHPSDASVAPEELSNMPSEERRRYALSPWSTQALLSSCAADTDYPVRGAVARNLLAPPELLATLWQDTDTNVRIGVASNVQTPPDVLAKISNSLPQDSAAEYALANPALPQELIETFADRADKASAPVFANAAIPPAALFAKGTVSKDDQVANWTSLNLASSPNALQRLAIRCIANLQSEGVSFRKWEKQVEILNQVGGHPAASELTLLNLTTIFGGSPIFELILSVCDRPVVPQTYWETVAQLSGAMYGIREELAAHLKCPAEVLEALAVDPDVYVRTAVHGNPKAPEAARAAALLAGIQ